jgi:hypothetical protein
VKVKRSDMKPGTVFAASMDWAGGWPMIALVVIDDKTEIEFWRGWTCKYGDIAPACYFEVLA